MHGVLYLDTYDAVTGGADEVAAIPYPYRPASTRAGWCWS